MSFTVPYPELFKGASGEYVDRPYNVEGKKVWQRCYVCGLSITFSKSRHQWIGIGAGLIRHNKCEPPPCLK